MSSRGQKPRTRGNGRNATRRPCPNCGQTILTGLDNDAAAFTANVDPQHLNHHAELHANTQGLRTYEIDQDNHLHRRHAHQLHQPAQRPVVADHNCPGPAPQQLELT